MAGHAGSTSSRPAPIIRGIEVTGAAWLLLCIGAAETLRQPLPEKSP
jgi:hypothetical protein